MIQMRWYATVSRPEPRLQYRQQYDVTIRAGLNWSNEELARTAKYEWSDWMDVPMVKE